MKDLVLLCSAIILILAMIGGLAYKAEKIEEEDRRLCTSRGGTLVTGRAFQMCVASEFLR